MLIADSQVHIWGANTRDRPWPARAKPHREPPLAADELLREMDAARVDRAVLVPPSWEGDRNDLALQVAARHPDRFAVMGRFDPTAAGAREALARWTEARGMLGMRFAFHLPMLREPLEAGHYDWVWGAIEEAGFPLMMLLPQQLMPAFEPVIAAHPRLRLVMDHLGCPSGSKDAAAFAGLEHLLALAKYPNVAVKASALPCYTTDAYPYRFLHPHFERVQRAFGRERVFWGTDLSRSPCTYRDNITLYTEEMPWLDAIDKEWLMGRGLCEWLGWPL